MGFRRCGEDAPYNDTNPCDDNARDNAPRLLAEFLQEFSPLKHLLLCINHPLRNLGIPFFRCDNDACGIFRVEIATAKAARHRLNIQGFIAVGAGFCLGSRLGSRVRIRHHLRGNFRGSIKFAFRLICLIAHNRDDVEMRM